MEKLVDERGHVYAATDQLLKAGRIGIYGMIGERNALGRRTNATTELHQQNTSTPEHR
jgi:hypothetical protein